MHLTAIITHRSHKKTVNETVEEEEEEGEEDGDNENEIAVIPT